MTGAPNELELKYRVTDPATGERLIIADEVAGFTTGRAARASRFEDRYVDTGDGALARAGFAVRLRQTEGGAVVSVKSRAHTRGPGEAIRREELEGPADPATAAADWPASDARAVVLEHAGDAALIERVIVRQLRRKRVIRSGTTRVELSLDEVDVVAGGQVVGGFVELEAELLKGPEEPLAELAAAFDREAGLRRSGSSKLEAALAVLASPDGADPGAPSPGPSIDDGRKGKSAAAVEAAPAPPAEDEPAEDAELATESDRLSVGKTPGVTADDHIAEAGRKVMRFHLARMLDYEAGTRSGLESEDLHKMRVATRRQRAAWRVFGEAYRPGRTKRYRTGLREIASRLGGVRDLDVQLEAADAYRADLPIAEQRALEPLLAAWRVHREAARVLLLRELDADRYRRWVDEYRDFVRTEGAQVLAVGPVQPHRVRDTAPSRIWAAYEVMRAYEPVLRWADIETLHELRIAGKWLRYTLEFVREALGPESAPLIARVTALQDHLGLMHDADVTGGMARSFLVEHAGQLSAPESTAIGRYLVDREQAVARLRRTIGPIWRPIAGSGYRRALGRVVAGL
ncbi:MAG: CHAD domain-containing protein [Chloroflexi bacterium]|nr:CHAD domain-containing protein [Chloroflexota bacterium]